MGMMWYLEKEGEGCILKVVVFNEEALKEYLDYGFEVTGEYEIEKVKGHDFLPDAIGGR